MEVHVWDLPTREAYQLENKKWNILQGIFQKTKKIPSEALILGTGKQGAADTTA